MCVSTRVTAASGQSRLVTEGGRLVFGRGPEVDMIIAAGRGLSRRAGVVTALTAGAWIANISRTHALYVEGDGYQVRLPRMEGDEEPVNGWFVRAGTAYVGSRAMLDERQPLVVTVSKGTGAGLAAARLEAGGRRFDSARGEDGTELEDGGGNWEAEGTLLPFYLDPMTKLFLVALIWCRPWLLDPRATRPLPRTPEIARGALEVTGAYHELERFDADQEYRDLLSARVAEHIKVLRRKIAGSSLADAGVRLSDEVAVRILIEHGIITSADLSRLEDPAWRSRQEDLWWTQD
jgi:hypothetical protein